MTSRIREDVNELFVCFCEIAKPASDNDGWIVTKFPENFDDPSILNDLPKFVFPCDPPEGHEHRSHIFDWAQNFFASFHGRSAMLAAACEKLTVQNYSFVLTNLESKWTFGFCRYDPKTGTALVFISYRPWHEVFFDILNKIAELIRDCEAKDLYEFLDNLMKIDPPEPEEKLIVPINQKISPLECIVPAQHKHKLPSIPQNRNLREYYNAVDVENILVIFASMLFERRIIFKSEKLVRLSACVQAANTVLYPMNWQHIFIPLLPKHLKEFLSAPMPFLIGIPTSTWETVVKSELVDVVVIDCDTNALETPFDDVSSLPTDVVKFLRNRLSNPQLVKDDGFARTFLKALVQLIGGYKDALKFQQGQKITFSPEAFIESRPQNMQHFLRAMLNLQIFQQFKDERLDMLNSGLGFSDEFELEAFNYMAKSSSSINEQYKDWVATMKKQGTALFKSVKNKVTKLLKQRSTLRRPPRMRYRYTAKDIVHSSPIQCNNHTENRSLANPAMKSAVKSVKERGKDVKSAYKGIKTRVKKESSSQSQQQVQASTFHRTRPLTVGAPVSAAATFKRQRASNVVPSRSNEYVPLDSPREEVASPSSEEDLPAPSLDMNLLVDIQDLINRKCSMLDESSPPVDRTLKPVWSTDGISSMGLTSTAGSTTHEFLTRPSPSLPLSFSTVAPTNPFAFSFSKPSPLTSDPFGFTSTPATTPFTIDSNRYNPFLPYTSSPPTSPASPMILDKPLLPPPPDVNHKKCNGTDDLIRLDSIPSQSEEQLSREDSTDSIKFKTGLMNPLYPYYSPNNSPLKLIPTQTSSVANTKAANGHPPQNANTSFVYSTQTTKPTIINKQDIDLLLEYGIDLNNSTENSTCNFPKDPLDPFDSPTTFDSPSKHIKQSAQSTWTTFD